MEQEGVIKYRLDFIESDCEPDQAALTELNNVRAVLMEKGMLGQDSERYQGFGFGNLSFRADRSEQFWISGSQTGYLGSLSVSDLALVVSSDARHNYLKAKGLTKPSSESMTHGVLYQINEGINAVIHVHCPIIWGNATRLNIKATQADIVYGTPEMAEAVRSLSSELLVDGLPIAFAMLGHEDGVVAAGNTLDDCLELLCLLQANGLRGL